MARGPTKLINAIHQQISIAIIAGVVNFLPHPNAPREFGEGVRNSQMI